MLKKINLPKKLNNFIVYKYIYKNKKLKKKYINKLITNKNIKKWTKIKQLKKNKKNDKIKI